MIDSIHKTLEILKMNKTVGEGVSGASTLEEFTRTYGNVRDALLYAPLFVPQFLEIDGHVFLKDFGVKIEGGWAAVEEGVRQTKALSPTALKSYVDGFNWVEVPYLFDSRSGTDDEDECLAAWIMTAWRCRLRDEYPHRNFVVRVIGSDKTGSVVGVGFEEVSKDGL